MEINKMSDDELKAVVDILKDTTMESYRDWLDDNYEPPEPDYDDDYDD